MSIFLAYFRDWPGYPVINDEINLNKVCLIYKCLSGLHVCPGTSLHVSDRSARTRHYGDITIHYAKYNHETEGGRTFRISAIKPWNSLPIGIRSTVALALSLLPSQNKLLLLLLLLL